MGTRRDDVVWIHQDKICFSGVRLKACGEDECDGREEGGSRQRRPFLYHPASTPPHPLSRVLAGPVFCGRASGMCRAVAVVVESKEAEGTKCLLTASESCGDDCRRGNCGHGYPWRRGRCFCGSGEEPRTLVCVCVAVDVIAVVQSVIMDRE